MNSKDAYEIAITESAQEVCCLMKDEIVLGQISPQEAARLVHKQTGCALSDAILAVQDELLATAI